MGSGSGLGLGQGSGLGLGQGLGVGLDLFRVRLRVRARLQLTRQFCAIHTAFVEHSPRAARLAQLPRLSSTSHRSALPQGQAPAQAPAPLGPAQTQAVDTAMRASASRHGVGVRVGRAATRRRCADEAPGCSPTTRARPPFWYSGFESTHLVARADAPAAEGALRAALRDRARRVALLGHVVARVALALAQQAPLDALRVAIDPHLLRARAGLSVGLAGVLSSAGRCSPRRPWTPPTCRTPSGTWRA